eukprot:gene6005-7480_t
MSFYEKLTSFWSPKKENPIEQPEKQWDMSSNNFTTDGPVAVDLSQSKKYICRCGQSKNYPYCDGSHNGYNQEHPGQPAISPLPLDKSDQVVYVCRCGYSKNKPFCDGTHNTLQSLKLIKNEKANKVETVDVVRNTLVLGTFVLVSYIVDKYYFIRN